MEKYCKRLFLNSNFIRKKYYKRIRLTGNLMGKSITKEGQYYEYCKRGFHFNNLSDPVVEQKIPISLQENKFAAIAEIIIVIEDLSSICKFLASTSGVYILYKKKKKYMYRRSHISCIYLKISAKVTPDCLIIYDTFRPRETLD